MSNDEVYQAAVRYVKRGWSVFPLWPWSKQPLVSSWAPYQNRLPSMDELVAWWHPEMGNPDSNIALVTGRLSGIVSLDIDGAEGEKSIAGKELPRTPCFESRPGHRQYLFAHPGQEVRNFEDKLPDVDFRGDGGYCLLPPSTHPKGTRYVWIVSPDECEPAPLPGWVLELAKRKKTDDLADLVDLLVPHWTVHQRHSLAIGLAGYLVKLEWPWPLMRELLSQIAKATDDEEEADRLKTVETTFRRLEEGKPIIGYQRLEEILPVAVLEKLELLAKRVIIPALMRRVDVWRRRKLPPFERRRGIARTVSEELGRSGRFIRTQGGELFWFSDEEHALYPIPSAALNALLNESFGLNSVETETKYTLEHLRAHTLRQGELAEVSQLARWDREGGVLYIYAGGGRVWRLDGTEIKEITNGDGVFFLPELGFEPFEPNWAVPHDPRSVLVGDIAFARGERCNLSPAQQAAVFWTWFLSLFFEEELPTKPILTLCGEKGGGKSLTQRRLAWLLYGPQGDAQGGIQDRDDFTALVTNRRYVILDNLEYAPPWLPDELSRLATGYTITKRQLYTTNTLVTFKPRSFVALNAVLPPFEDTATIDRFLILHLSKRKRLTPESMLERAILSARNEIWAGLLAELNRLIPFVRTEPQPTPHRMADFADLGRRIAIAEGHEKEWTKLLDGLELGKHHLALANSDITDFMEEWLKDPTASRKEGWTSAQLYHAFQEIAHEKGWRMPAKNVKSLGRQISSLSSALEAIYGIWKEVPRNCAVYYLRGR
jgi:hypothetical protein